MAAMTERPGVHLCATVADDANYNFLPAFLTPGPAYTDGQDFDDTMHRSREEFFVLVVHLVTTIKSSVWRGGS
jgi:hypothetical protein